MIDTPGFGDDLENEERTIDELVDVLKNKVIYRFKIIQTLKSWLKSWVKLS